MNNWQGPHILSDMCHTRFSYVSWRVVGLTCVPIVHTDGNEAISFLFPTKTATVCQDARIFLRLHDMTYRSHRGRHFSGLGVWAVPGGLYEPRTVFYSDTELDISALPAELGLGSGVKLAQSTAQLLPCGHLISRPFAFGFTMKLSTRVGEVWGVWRGSKKQQTTLSVMVQLQTQGDSAAILAEVSRPPVYLNREFHYHH